MGISTHVLDTSLGKPASGVAVVLEREGVAVARGVTDADGRARLVAEAPSPGRWRIVFATGPYLSAGGQSAFFPEVAIAFEIAAGDPAGHYHVPLLLSPFGYSTYRGS
jgi:5-hydroxyisourate hydrolase